jgi:hypothetical protein
MVVSGVRRSCEIADSSELRKRSDSMLTSASLRDFDVVNTLERKRNLRGERVEHALLLGNGKLRPRRATTASTPRVRIGALSGK